MLPLTDAVEIFALAFGWFGVGGCCLLLTGIFFPAVIYRGRHGERYSPLNHFISELGERGISRGAPVFNTCLFLSGLLLLAMSVGVGLTLGSPAGWLGAAAGAWTAVSCSLIGVFSMERLEAHLRAATAFFRGGWATLLLFTIAFALQPAGAFAVPGWVHAIGLFGIAAYSAFLLIALRPPSGKTISDVLGPALEKRPRVWIIPILEWLLFLPTVLWFFCISIIRLAL